MEATIQRINVYNDGNVEIVVICNACYNTNCYNITKSTVKQDDKIAIDFTNLGKRCCDNYGKPNNLSSICYADYKLYT
jgi:hypothetical protein